MAKTGLEANIVARIGLVREARRLREASPRHKGYINALNKLTEDLKEAASLAITDPEFGVRISRECIQFTLKEIPDPLQDKGRATSLGQCDILEERLAKVRKPDIYLQAMKKQFGPDLDPRQYPTAEDGFGSIISSQTARISAEAKGLNTSAEQKFCRKRVELLLAVDKGYSLLRDQALGIENKPQQGQGMGR
jgi:hypothetical protein